VSADKTDKKTVAVVITTYNHAHFLADALHSVVAQRRRADEVVVVDDGSSDDPAAMVAAFAGVTLLRQHNQGLAAARNTGLAAVHSEAVVFLDADDRLLPGALAAGLACFAAAPPACAYVYGAHRRIDADGRPTGATKYDAVGPEPYRDLLLGNLIGMHATVMYDRAALLAAGAFDRTLARCEDYDVYLRLARTAPVSSHPTLVAEYRWHGHNMSADPQQMLDAALHVHARHEALAQGEAADDWRRGQRIWREYYAAEMLSRTRRAWSSQHSPAQAARGVLQAMKASAPTTARALARQARARLRRAPADAHAAPAVGTVRWGDLDRTAPVSDDFGYERGTPIDRFYIERFLEQHAGDIAGRALEVGDDAYCRRFGAQRITQQDVLHVSADNPAATLVGDLSVHGTLPPGAFDCLVLTQTLHLVFDMAAAVAEMHRGLKPGGVVLLTVPGITRIDRGQWGGEHWFWSLTAASATRLFGTVFGAEQVQAQSHGNVFAATAFLQGLALEEVERGKLEVNDACFPVIVTVRAKKRSVAPS
jgi:GT2 family glycosyltransferase/SAM-dependent methyltransferase